MAKPESRFFRVKNFDKFQHYRDRHPPWIRLYNTTLDDYELARLPDASKAHLFAIWLLASRSDNRIPYDADWIGSKINATEPVNLDTLLAAGKIELIGGRSKLLAERKQDDALEESRAETDSLTQRAKGTRLGTDWKPSEKHYDLGKQLNLTTAEVDAAADRFREYFESPDATRPVKKDWDGAFSRWLRTDAPKIVANRARGSRPNGNHAARGSITAARDSILAKAGVPPKSEQSQDQEFQARGGARPERNSASDPSAGPIIDADDWSRSPGPSDGTEGPDETTIEPNDSGHRGSDGGLSQTDHGVPGGRGETCPDDTGERIPLVAGVEGASGTHGLLHGSQTHDVPSDDIGEMPAFLRRHPSAA